MLQQDSDRLYYRTLHSWYDCASYVRRVTGNRGCYSSVTFKTFSLKQENGDTLLRDQYISESFMTMLQ